jgi:hypothetical protein
MDELRYWNYGDNPAFKKFMKIGMENTRGKQIVDHRTHILDRGVRYFLFNKDCLCPETSTISSSET